MWLDGFNKNLVGDSDSSPGRVYLGRIIAVDTLKYTAKVSFGDGRLADDVGWLSAYQFLNGNGLYVMPQPGSKVVMLEHVPGAFIIIGFYPAKNTETNDRTGSRRRLNLGDICIQGKDDCFILLKQASNYIIAKTSPGCYVELVNGSGINTINVFVQRAIFRADGGLMTWDSNEKTHETTFNWIFVDKSLPNHNLAQVTIGFHATEDPDAQAALIDKSVFSLIVKEVVSDQDGQVQSDITKFKFIVGANGRIVCSAESIKEIYRDFIDRYADTFIKDIAKAYISRESLESDIIDTAKEIAYTTAKTIHHNKGS